METLFYFLGRPPHFSFLHFLSSHIKRERERETFRNETGFTAVQGIFKRSFFSPSRHFPLRAREREREKERERKREREKEREREREREDIQEKIHDFSASPSFLFLFKDIGIISLGNLSPSSPPQLLPPPTTTTTPTPTFLGL